MSEHDRFAIQVVLTITAILTIVWLLGYNSKFLTALGVLWGFVVIFIKALEIRVDAFEEQVQSLTEKHAEEMSNIQHKLDILERRWNEEFPD